MLAAVAVSTGLLLASCKDNHHNHGGSLSSNDGVGEEYPLTTCVVSGEDLGSMGDPVTLSYKGTTVKLCCSSCKDDFHADPEKYLAKLK